MKSSKIQNNIWKKNLPNRIWNDLSSENASDTYGDHVFCFLEGDF